LGQVGVREVAAVVVASSRQIGISQVGPGVVRLPVGTAQVDPARSAFSRFEPLTMDP
jgi:hypothetical protein